MGISKTNTKRYMALCDVADCRWSWGPHGLRVTVSERLRHHMSQAHGLRRVADTLEGKRHMKTRTKDQDLPPQESGPKLSEYEGKLVVFAKGWTEQTRGTSFGERATIEVDLWAYDADEKAWDHVGPVSVFFRTVQAQLRGAGPDDDFGGVLVQGTDRNKSEWQIETPNAAQSKLLDKFDPSF